MFAIRDIALVKFFYIDPSASQLDPLQIEKDTNWLDVKYLAGLNPHSQLEH